MLITVKADTRIDNTIEAVRTYAECFQDLSHLLGVCVTHMDTVTWTRDTFLACLGEDLDIHTAVCVGLDTPKDAVLEQILEACKEPQDIAVTSDNFLKFFKINNNSLKILKCVRDEVSRFQVIKKEFEDILKTYGAKDRVDLVFEFQAYMTQQITEGQKRVSEKNQFTFEGADMPNELGHIANLTNQLRAVLFEVRTLVLGYTQNNMSDMRKCPHCGLVWTKIEGCDGSTTCGNPVTQPFDVRDKAYLSLANFTFGWDGKKFEVKKTGSHQVERSSDSSTKSWKGCGKEIKWTEMSAVDIPPEFRACSDVSTDDVELIPGECKRTWQEVFSNTMNHKHCKVTRL